jgi:hypothetical protein
VALLMSAGQFTDFVAVASLAWQALASKQFDACMTTQASACAY